MIVTVANEKGGVGKTDLCVNLASNLAKMGKRVLVIDLDPQANATEYLRKQPATRRDSGKLLTDNKLTLKRTAVKTGIENLYLVPGSKNLSAAQVEIINDPGMQFKLKRKLARHGYDYVFIDTPPSLGLLTLNALTASDRVLAPVSVNYLATRGMKKLNETMKIVRKEINPNLGLQGIVLTMHNRRNNLTTRIEKDVRRAYGKKVYRTVIPINVDLAEAPRSNQPIMLHSKESRGAYAYERLANEFTGG